MRVHPKATSLRGPYVFDDEVATETCDCGYDDQSQTGCNEHRRRKRTGHHVLGRHADRVSAGSDQPSSKSALHRRPRHVKGRVGYDSDDSSIGEALVYDRSQDDDQNGTEGGNKNCADPADRQNHFHCIPSAVSCPKQRCKKDHFYNRNCSKDHDGNRAKWRRVELHGEPSPTVCVVAAGFISTQRRRAYPEWRLSCSMA